MVKFTFLSTLVFVFLSGVISHFNKCYSPPLTSVKKINTANPILLGKDNQLDHSTKLDYRLRTVVIDPGHGGNDRGCKGTHSKEKHISLKIAKKLGNYIKNKFPNVTVIYTRDKDVFVPLHRRAD
ncbi:MAG TPA: N-acetylmuramoyl-L-alanine amidase, partial [Phaeodactylibacter sp.]|nr:N-acetylmuramoyl-L-alanine amidase [Phaeodactylibacter sp.]